MLVNLGWAKVASWDRVKGLIRNLRVLSVLCLSTNATSTNFFRAPTHGLERELRHILTCDPSCDGNVEKAIKSSRSEGGGTGL